MNVIVAVILFVVGGLLIDKFSTLLGVVLFSTSLAIMCLLVITTDVAKLVQVLFSQKSLPETPGSCIKRPVAQNIFCLSLLIEFIKRNQSGESTARSIKKENSILTCSGINQSPCTSNTENNALTCTNSSVSEEIKVCVNHIMRMYIESWYADIGANQDFVKELNYVLEDLFVALSNSLSTVNALKFAENSLLICHHHFTRYLQAVEIAKQKIGVEAFKDSAIRQNEIQNVFKMLYPAQRGNSEEENYLKNIAGIIVDSLGPVDLLTCTVLHTLVIDIIAQNVLEPLVDFVCDPTWIYLSLINVLSPEKKIVEEKCSYPSDGDNLYCPKTEIHNEEITTSEISTSDKSKKDTIPQLIIQSDSISEKLCDEVSSEMSDAEFCVDFERRSPSLGSSGSDSSAIHLTALKLQPLETNLNRKDKNSCKSSSEYSSSSGETWHNVNYNQLDANNILYGTKVKASSNINLCNEAARADDVISTKSDAETESYVMKRSHSLDFLSQVHFPALLHLSNFDITGKRGSKKEKHKDSRQKFGSQSEKEDSLSVEEAEEAIEIDRPPLFINIHIVGTKQQVESTRGTYTLYNIQYDGLFTYYGSMNEVKFVRQPVVVNRRFREFLTLHSRLEDNPKLKRFMKGVKAPSKWHPNMFTNLEKKNIEERMHFLEQYLKVLCKVEVVAKSLEMREFLAYGVDASIAYVKKAPELNVPRIDKMFVKGVKGAFDLLQKALPSLPPDSPINYDEEHHKIVIPGFGKRRKSDSRQEANFVYGNKKNSVLIKRISSYTMNHDLNSSIDCWGKPELSPDQTESQFGAYTFPQKPSASTISENHINSNISEGDYDKNNPSEELRQALLQEIPLATLVIDFLVKCIRDDCGMMKKTSLVLFIKQKLGKYIDKHFSKFAKRVFSEEFFVVYLHFLHESLWSSPNENETSQFSSPDEASRERLKLDALHRIKNYISGFMALNLFISSDQMEDSATTLLEALQNPQLNRCLFYNLIDLLLDEMFQNRMESS